MHVLRCGAISSIGLGCASGAHRVGRNGGAHIELDWWSRLGQGRLADFHASLTTL